MALPLSVMAGNDSPTALVHSFRNLPQASQLLLMNKAQGWVHNNPTQAKRRLEWATLLLLMAVIILPGIEALPWRAVVEQKAFVILRGFGSIA